VGSFLRHGIYTGFSIGKKKKKEGKIETTGQKYKGLTYFIGRP